MTVPQVVSWPAVYCDQRARRGGGTAVGDPACADGAPLRDPKALAPWYNATGTSLYVIGTLVTAFALRFMASAGGG